jgi:anti-anti-sigma regulatory factor
MDNYKINFDRKTNILFICVAGYLNRDAGQELKNKVQKELYKGVRGVIFDLTKAEAINSQGTAAILDICIIIADDYAGQTFIFGLNESQYNFFQMAGIFAVAQPVADLKTAIKNVA